MAEITPLTKDDWEKICPKCGKEKPQESDFCPDCERMLCPCCKKYFTDGKLCEGCKSADHEKPAQPTLKVPPSPGRVRLFAVALILVTAIGGAFWWMNMATKQANTITQVEVSIPPEESPIPVTRTETDFDASRPAPVAYRVCKFDDISTSTGIKRMKVIIATEERDMAMLSTEQLAATAYSAMNYFNDGPLHDYLLINVLLMESCASKSVTLARAQIGEGQRIVQASSTMENGPSALAITVTESIEQQKGGRSRATTAADYAAVARKMKMQPAKVKQLHFELASHSSGDDFYDPVAGTPATSPVAKK